LEAFAALAALALLGHVCLGVNTTVTMYEPLPGAATGYVVTVTAPEGSRVLLYPAAGTPPIELRPLEGGNGGCAVYRAGPLSLGEGARIVVVTPSGGEEVVPLQLPAPNHNSTTAVESGGGAEQPGYGETRQTIGNAASRASPASTSSPLRGDDGGRSLDLLVIVASLVLLLALQVVRPSSPRS